MLISGKKIQNLGNKFKFKMRGPHVVKFDPVDHLQRTRPLRVNFWGSLCPFFLLKNCMVSLLTSQNGTCEQLATKATDL